MPGNSGSFKKTLSSLFGRTWPILLQNCDHPPQICSQSLSEISHIRKAKAKRNWFFIWIHFQVDDFVFCFWFWLSSRMRQTIIIIFEHCEKKTNSFPSGNIWALYSFPKATSTGSSLANASDKYFMWLRQELIYGGKFGLVTCSHLSCYFSHANISSIRFVLLSGHFDLQQLHQM